MTAWKDRHPLTRFFLVFLFSTNKSNPMKNYIGFVNDHSGSMALLAKAAIKDYNTMIASVRDAASREMLDTIVSTVGIGFSNPPVKRQVVNSNPHVLKEVTRWKAEGMTPLYDGVMDMIELFEGLPDAHEKDVSFLVSVTTDGGENSSHVSASTLRKKLEQLQATGRWTFVFRVPRGHRTQVNDLGVPSDNIQEWDTTSKGMEEASMISQAAMNNYFTARASGATSSTTFYADATKVDTSKLTDISKKVSLYVVPDTDMGIEIRDFILRHRMEYLKGAAFYQLTKTEARVGHKKMILVRDRSTGQIFAGSEARQMIGMPTDKNARLHPGDHGNFDIFIQSESVNRKLVAGTGVVYWAEIGVPFTEADLAYLKPKDPAATKPAGPVVLPKVTPTNKPTKSPIPKKAKAPTPSVNGGAVKFFQSRDDARYYARAYGLSQRDLKDYPNAFVVNPEGLRWFVIL